MPVKNRIVLLYAYYGPFPWYFKYFLHTCGFNAGVNFVLITDNAAPPDLPPNVRFENLSLSRLQQMASVKLGFEVALHQPYKLCDLKPAYGYLFPHLIEGFEFWGHGDIDVIYGNIRNFMTDDVLNRHDVITVINDFISGSFTLFRNAEKTNRLFMESRDYVKVYADSKNYCFDETNGAFAMFMAGADYDKIDTEVESMTHVVRRLMAEGQLTAYFNNHILEGLPGMIKWINGTMVWKNKIEAMMFHLILFKYMYRPPADEGPLGDYFEIKAARRLMFDNPAVKPVNPIPKKTSGHRSLNQKSTRNA